MNIVAQHVIIDVSAEDLFPETIPALPVRYIDKDLVGNHMIDPAAILQTMAEWEEFPSIVVMDLKRLLSLKQEYNAKYVRIVHKV